MIDFFVNKPSNIEFPIKKVPKWDYIRRMYRFSIDNLVSYYNSRSIVIKNNHILSKIIGLAYPFKNLGLADDIKFLKYIDVNSKYVAKHFRLVNNITNGEIFHNIFYKENSVEIICQTDFNYDFKDVMENYLNYSPIRVVYTEETALDFHMLDGKKSKKEPSLTVVELDITLMLLMYRAWCKRRLKFGMSINENLFIGSIVIPNAIRPMVDNIIFNRFIKIAKNEHIPDFELKHPMFVYDLSRGVDEALKSLAPHLVDNSILLEHFINTIPTIYNTDMFETLKLNRSMYNRQSLWSIWMARVKYIDTLIDLLGTNGMKRNTVTLFSLPYDIRELKNRNTSFYSKLDSAKGIDKEYKETVDRIYNKVFQGDKKQ